MGRSLVVLLSLLAPAVAVPGVARAEGGARNVVLVFNEADALTRSGAGAMVAPVGAPGVEAENLAYAKSSCNDCRSVAAALQVVLITGDANVIEPRNAAVAVNESGTSCSTFAGAYQYVVTTGGPVHLTPEGEQAIAPIRGRARALAASDLPFDRLEASLDALYEELRQTVDGELQRAGRAYSSRTARQIERSAGGPAS